MVLSFSNVAARDGILKKFKTNLSPVVVDAAIQYVLKTVSKLNAVTVFIKTLPGKFSML